MIKISFIANIFQFHKGTIKTFITEAFRKGAQISIP